MLHPDLCEGTPDSDPISLLVPTPEIPSTKSSKWRLARSLPYVIDPWIDKDRLEYLREALD